jgi:hypothetical protein
MDTLLHSSRKGYFLVIAFLILVAVSATSNVQWAAGQSACGFTVVSFSGGGQLSSGVTTGGYLNITGNAAINGSCGGIHSNDNIDIIGSPDISGDVTAAGNITVSGNPMVGGSTTSAVDFVPIPSINPADFAAYADYQLRADGKVYQSNGSGGWTQVVDLAGGGTWNNWDYQPSRWRLSKKTTIDGTLFIEGDVQISSSPGSSSDPWEATIIATGYIDVSGSPNMIPNPNNPPETGNLLFVAGSDLEVTGTPNQSLQGIMAAHEQIHLGGNPSFNGCLIAEDAQNNSGLVSENKITGSVNFTCNDCPFPIVEQIIEITEPY